MASSLQDDIATFVATPQNKETNPVILARILRQIEQEGLKKLIERLGTFLTSTDNAIRSRGMSLLASAIEHLGKAGQTLDPQTSSVLVAFLLERLEDYATLHQDLDALHALLTHHSLPDSTETPVKIARGIFNSPKVHIQSQQQTTRRVAFETLFTLLDKFLPALKSMKGDIVFGFIQAMDGEKDPRNLILCFRLVPMIVTAVAEYTQFEEDLFEVTSCYFPITFTERPSDVHGIKKMDLILGLRRTMIASPQQWIPFLLDKLSSSVVETKLDALASLRFGIVDTSTRGEHQTLWLFKDMKSHLPEIRAALIQEVTQSTDTSVPTTALQVLTDLTAFISSADASGLEAFLAPLIKQCSVNFQEKQDTKLSATATTILQAAAASSYEAAAIVFKEVLPLLISKYLSENESSPRLSLVKTLLSFVKGTAQFIDLKRDHPLTPYRVKLYNIFKSSMMTSSNDHERVDAIDGVATMATLNQGQLVDFTTVSEGVTLLLDALTSPPPQTNSSPPSELPFSSVSSSSSLSSSSLSQNLPRKPPAGSTSTIQITTVPAAALWALAQISLTHPSLTLTHALPTLFEQLERQLRLYATLSRPHDTSAMLISSDDAMDVEPHIVVDQGAAIESAKVAMSDRISWLHALCDPNVIKPVVSTLSEANVVPSAGTSSPDPVSTRSLDQSHHHRHLKADPSVLEAIQQVLISLFAKHYDIDFLISHIFSSLARTLRSKRLLLRIFSIIVRYGERIASLETQLVLSRWCPDLVTNAMRHFSHSEQFSLVSVMVRAFMEGDYAQLLSLSTPSTLFPSSVPSSDKMLDEGASSQTSIPPFRPFAQDAPAYQKKLVPILAAVVSACQAYPDQPQAELPSRQEYEETYREIARQMFASLLLYSNPTAYCYDGRDEDIICTCIASIINKLGDGLDQLLEDIVSQKLINGILQQPSAEQSSIRHAVAQKVLVWVVKALIQRSHTTAERMWDLLMQQFNITSRPAEEGHDNVEHIRRIASRLKVMFTDIPQLPVRRILYKQKYFNRGLSQLVNLYNSGASSHQQKAILLLAVAQFLHGLPQSVLIQSAPVLIPLLLQAIDSPDPTLRADTLPTFQLLIETDQTIVQPHLPTLIPLLLNISSDPSNPGESRQSALECLTLFTTFPPSQIMPFKDKVVSQLRKALDDKKRVVRRAAVKCRNEWFVVSPVK